MKIAVIGTGYIGLVTGACLAKLGHQVICVDRDEAKINLMRSGQSPIYEPGLSELMQECIASDSLLFTSDTTAATKVSEAIFVAVGTPTADDGSHADLSHIFAAAREIAQGLDSFKIVVVKSTVPAGTGRRVQQEIKAANPDAEFEMASNPEFLREGTAIFDFMNPDRIIVGVDGPRARAVMDGIYVPLTERQCPLFHVSLESAEIIKYASNAFLATKISFINEMATLCETLGANVLDVARGMGADARIGPKFLNPGPGFGGSCFPKDTRALVALATDSGVELQITRAVISSNEAVKHRMVEKIVKLVGGSVSGKIICVFGVTFKADTDDIRDAPSLTIVPALQQQGAVIRIVDPKGFANGQVALPGVQWFDDPYEAAESSDAIVILTEWRQFRILDLRRISASMTHPRMADLRNLFKASELKAAGFDSFTHAGIG
jgi:UDPglucose 6-dehydrogenase